MASTKRRYSKEEFARRGDAICEKDILHKLTAKDVGTAGGDEEVLRQLLPSFSRD